MFFRKWLLGFLDPYKKRSKINPEFMKINPDFMDKNPDFMKIKPDFYGGENPPFFIFNKRIFICKWKS